MFCIALRGVFFIPLVRTRLPVGTMPTRKRNCCQRRIKLFTVGQVVQNNATLAAIVKE